jgi:hypothetical protein
MGAKATTRKTKKSTAGAAKQAREKKAAAKQTRAKKTGAKKTAAGKSGKSGKAGKADNAKTQKTRKSTQPATASRPARGKARNRTTEPATDTPSVELAIDDLTAVDDLVAAPTAAAKDSRKRGPRTPSVPRTVKPAPKLADIEMDAEVLAFIDAVDAYKQRYSRPFPTWSEVFFIFRRLGYRLV